MEGGRVWGVSGHGQEGEVANGRFRAFRLAESGSG